MAGELSSHLGAHGKLRLNGGLRLLCHQDEAMTIQKAAQELCWQRIAVPYRQRETPRPSARAAGRPLAMMPTFPEISSRFRVVDSEASSAKARVLSWCL